MIRFPVAALFALVVVPLALLAQDRPQPATVKAVDPKAGTVTLTVDGKDRTFRVVEKSRVFGAEGKSVADRLAGIKAGGKVLFKAESRDGAEVLVGLKAEDASAPDRKNRPAPVKVDTASLKPLMLLGTEKYQGFEGGLYPDGKNERPAAHEVAGLALAKQIQPLGSDGQPAANGKVVLLSVGMSNTTQEFSTFQRVANADAEKNPAVVVVDGAQGGMTAFRIKNPDDNASGTQYWTTVDQRLKAAGATRDQVQVAWIKEADAGPTQGFPKYAETLRDELRQIVRAMHTRFPNLKLVYLSSRTYAGFARSALNPEPYAYESGFSVKWLIEAQMTGDKELNFDPKKGAVAAPWLSWGPYLWANGPAKNPDGLSYEESDFGNDGTHPSDAGRRKVAGELLTFFKTDATTKGWFVRGR